MSPDYYIIPLVIGQVSHIITSLKTGNIIFDCCLFGLLYLLYYTVNIRDVKRRLFTLVRSTGNKKTIIITTSEHKHNNKFRAIMFYL